MRIVIKTFTCKKTRNFFIKGEVSGFFKTIEKQTKRKLTMLHFASTLNDLAKAPGNRLEPLKGKRKGQHSMRINDQYRICFRFKEGNAYDVEVTDYH